MKAGAKYSFFYRNGLSIVALSLFLCAWGAQAITGWHQHNQDLAEKHGVALGLLEYLQSGHFISATFENFECEFLQMSLYVVLTVGLRQIGSAESKSLDKPEEVDREPIPSPDAPWPVRKGGWILKVYKNSLFLAFLILFIVTWYLHFYGSWLDNNQENLLSGEPQESMLSYLGEPNFWFESFQNWQSEFLSIASIVILTIFLRQKGSPESKPVDARDEETGK